MKKGLTGRIVTALACLIILAGYLFVPSADRRADAETRTITMGTSPDYPPYESVDAVGSGEIVGLDIDIAKYISDKLGYKLEISPSDFDGLIAALQTRRVDFVMSGMSVTEERKQSVDFSDSYYLARNTIVSLSGHEYKSLDELKGKKLGVQLGSTQETAAKELEGVTLLSLNKIPDLIQALQAGRVDALIVEDAVAAGYANANENLKFTMVPAAGGDEGYAIAFPKGSPLREEFNSVLSQMKSDGTLQQMIDASFGTETAAPSDSGGGTIDFGVLKPYMSFLLKGIYVTLLFTIVSAAFGFIWGAVLSLFKLSNIPPLRWFSTVYTSIFRGTPLLLQLLLLFYAIPQLFHYNIPPLLAAGLAFGLNSAAYLSETIRGGILAVDKGQREASLALGIPYRTMMISIIMPQAIKNILPALVNECVALVKESSLVSVIGVADLLRRSNIVQADTYRALEPLLFIGAIYYVLVLVLTSLARLLERRMRRSD
ncbi:ABC transporter substrate-binding protein/permease [Cohnella lubricantis]|uniref:ABC transporter substrate-binding protein/permease n=1 Tax=Cohnella lubricantis TaxID=2163172 RepID=A0A841T7I5_9BACL|nr:ABC transporter substrate-binding protein/permease [Cohnella lubricantis]MBB6676016.1 ABC transporter substrate-binding protein/permease [Cohnella lubricantis]MBP2117971.1 polar amino acid transport system substrate-binding protein [Cohnella lubricantis]